MQKYMLKLQKPFVLDKPILPTGFRLYSVTPAARALLEQKGADVMSQRQWNEELSQSDLSLNCDFLCWNQFILTRLKYFRMSNKYM